MMLSVLVWLAMQGQVQAQSTADCIESIQRYQQQHGYISVPASEYAACQYGDGRGHCIDPFTQSKPAEHVIEIKTRRVRVKVLHYGETCPKDSVPRWIMSSDADVVCERVTRELWIDGVRWGVIKGLE